MYVCVYIYIYLFYTCRSQTYSANEIDMVLAEDADTGKPIEWVDIDPEAFTGAMFTHFTIYFSYFVGIFQHGQINLIKSASEDIYNIIKYFYYK